MNLLDRLRALKQAAPGSVTVQRLKLAGVTLTPQERASVPKREDLISETMRIVDLPQVDYSGVDLTARYLRPGAVLPFEDVSGSLIHGLRPVQSEMLAAIEACQGGLFPVGVGHGKAAVAILAPTALNAKLAIILTTSGTLHQLRRTFATWRRYFRTIDNVHILSYDQLSTQTGTDLLERLAAGVPDHQIVIVSDEAHKLKHKDAARTKRLLRFFDGDPHAGTKGHPEARFVALSGTMTAKSLRDFAHLSRLALRNLSPVPRDEHDLDAWSECVDVEGIPGDLHWRRVEPLWRAFSALAAKPMSRVPYEERRTGIRKAFQVRLRSCPGVVATEEQSIGCSLVIHAHHLTPPQKVTDAILAAFSGLDPTGEPLPDATAEARVAKQLSCGFYYLWDWPELEDRDWMVARRKWNALVRAELKANATQGYDSEFLVASKIDREVEKGYGDELHVAWRHWRREKQKRWKGPDGALRPYPPTKTIWIDPFYADAAARFAKTFREPTILWYESRALQAALRERGLLVCAAGEEPPTRPVLCALSSRAHGEGLNLQGWTRNVMLEPMSSGERWEQCLDSFTEILTADGWMGIDDPPEKAAHTAAYDIEDGSIRWAKGERIKRGLGDELMYGIQNPHLDIRVTAGHRMVHEGIRRVGNGGVDGFAYTDRVFVAASKMPQRGRIPINGMQQVSGAPLTDAELLFIGLFMTDGNLSKGNGAISLFQSDRYPEIVELIEQTLRACGFRFHHSIMGKQGSTTNYGVRQHALHRWAVSWGRPLTKGDRHLRGWGALAPYLDKDCALLLEDMTSAQLRVLLKGMWAGDGAKTKGTYSYDRYEAGTLSICSARPLTVARIQSLCVRRGMRCNVTPPRGGSSVWMLHISEDSTWTVLNMKLGDGRPSWGILPSVPEESVWCVAVDTGAIITRRNGKVAVVGNCLGRTHRPGQIADEVEVHLFQHTAPFRNAVRQAREDARYIEDSTGNRQKLNYAVFSGFDR